MGLIKEPRNVDFFVDPKPLTDEEQKMISDYIKKDKRKTKQKKSTEKKEQIQNTSYKS